jgi:hypothetical protein
MERRLLEQMLSPFHDAIDKPRRRHQSLNNIPRNHPILSQSLSDVVAARLQVDVLVLRRLWLLLHRVVANALLILIASVWRKPSTLPLI